MSMGDSSGSLQAADRHWAGIQSARRQVEAARLRQPQWAAPGRAQRVSSDAAPARFPPGYRRVRELHRGGQGIVYLAIQESTGREVAIKLLHRTLPPDAEAAQVARFAREVEILSRLKHPNIVAIHDCGRDHDHVYLVMDYVQGRRLDAYVAATAPPLRDTLALLAVICEGVHAAHLRGVIHRDLKPANILVDERGEPHVLDFGLAKLVTDPDPSADAQAMTTTGQFVGSLPWASPEQAEGRLDQLDIRTDVYSLGVVFYQLLTGAFPYPVHGRVAEVVVHIATTPPTRPGTLRREIDHDLETILLKCLAKEPERRYQGAGELARDLRHYLAGEPIEARRDSLAYVLRKRLARHRVATVAGATAVLAVTGALVASLAFWRQAEHQRVLAQEGAAAAVAAAQHADEEAAQARAVTDFMREVLTSVDPDRHGADVRLIDILAPASATAPERFAGLPLQEAQVRDLLGQVYDKLSMWNESKAEFGRAVDLLRQGLGLEDPRTLAAETKLTHALLNLSLADEAERHLTQLLPRMERVFGPEDSRVLWARRDAAIPHILRNRFDVAEPILRELRDHPQLIPDDRGQIRILNALVAVLLRRATVAEDAAKTAILSEAETLAQDWVERSARVFGSDSVHTLHAQTQWAWLVCQLGRYETAAETARTILELSERLGPCHQLRDNATHTLAEALCRLGDEQQPAALNLARLDCLRQKVSPRNPVLLGALSETLKHVERAGRAAEGEALARELAAALRELGGGHGYMLLESETYVAHFVSVQQRLDEAERLYVPLLSQEPNITDALTRARLHLFYGAHLTRRGIYPEAERELQAAAAPLEDIRQGTLNDYPDDIILAFMDLYRAWNQPEQVKAFERLRAEARSATGH